MMDVLFPIVLAALLAVVVLPEIFRLWVKARLDKRLARAAERQRQEMAWRAELEARKPPPPPAEPAPPSTLTDEQTAQLAPGGRQ